MKTKRLQVLGLLLAISLLAILTAFLWPSDEPTYQGKSVSLWFEEYAQPRILPSQFRVVQRPGVTTFQAPGNFGNSPYPAWEALQQFGSNGVPYIARYVRTGASESRFYSRLLTNLPAWVRSKLPSPFESRLRRQAAVRVITDLGEHAHSAGPVLLAELRRSDVTFHEGLLRALWSIGVEPRCITEVMIELGRKAKYAEMVSIAARTGWSKDDAVAELLGEALTAQDADVRTRALRLLEKAGPHATPALPRIISSVAHEDPETRYLAVRALRAIGTNPPAVMDALRSRLNDDNNLVRGAAQRSLR